MMTSSKRKWNEEISTYTGEQICLYKVECKCGHIISFLSNHYAICRHCGRKVYPTKKSEFKDKLVTQLRRNK